MKNFSKWKDEEVVSLFETIEKFKEQNLSLLSAFENYAKKTNRQKNSVRNYYYLELKELKENPLRQQRLNINLSKHLTKTPNNFSETETENFIYNILKLKSQGYSIRKACLTISNNEISKMVRLQNKFRNITKTNPELIEKTKEILKEEGFNLKTNERKNNIISMPVKSKSKLTNNEITSLFLGLVKLVKKCATEEAQETFQTEINHSNSVIRKSLIKINGLENENKNLAYEIKISREEKEKLKEELRLLKTEFASLIKDDFEKFSHSKNYLKLSKFFEDNKQKINSKLN